MVVPTCTSFREFSIVNYSREPDRKANYIVDLPSLKWEDTSKWLSDVGAIRWKPSLFRRKPKGRPEDASKVYLRLVKCRTFAVADCSYYQLVFNLKDVGRVQYKDTKLWEDSLTLYSGGRYKSISPIDRKRKGEYWIVSKCCLLPFTNAPIF